MLSSLTGRCTSQALAGAQRDAEDTGCRSAGSAVLCRLLPRRQPRGMRGTLWRGEVGLAENRQGNKENKEITVKGS